MDHETDADRESFAIQGNIIMNTLSDLLQRTLRIEQELLPASESAPLHKQVCLCKVVPMVDIYRSGRSDGPPKKRRKTE